MDNTTSELLPLLIGAGIGLLALSYFFSIWRRRENVRSNFKSLILAAAIGYIEFLIFHSNERMREASPIIGFLSALFIYSRRPRGSRRIRKSVRRQVISKWEGKTGKRFDSKLYELDHIVPFSKGGSHTVDNLRVLERKLNRSKGAQNPWWDIFGLWQ